METMLITGGTGFLGKHLGFAYRDMYRVVLGARNQKQSMAAREVTGCETVPLDVASIESVRDAVVAHRPSLVIHAAATKFVDLAEREPMEATDINIVGSQNVARVAVEQGVPLVVGISTDKAAPPVLSTYGMTKAVMERIFCSMNGKTDTRFACVRYGNVAWSTGSVLPVWKRMIETKGHLVSTGPDMTRFFFTVDEAVRLIQVAVENADLVSGNILSREMKSATMRRIADIWTVHTGTSWAAGEGRPGDRVDENLIGEPELDFTQRMDLNGIVHYLISPNVRADDPITEPVQSGTAARLSDEEILRLLNSPPAADYL